MNTMILANIMEQTENLRNIDQEVTGKTLSSVESARDLYADEDLPDPIEYLKSIMSQRGLRDIDLKADIGSYGNISSVLNRHKPLSLKMIRNIHNHLRIPAKILIQPYDCH